MKRDVGEGRLTRLADVSAPKSSGRLDCLVEILFATGIAAPTLGRFPLPFILGVRLHALCIRHATRALVTRSATQLDTPDFDLVGLAARFALAFVLVASRETRRMWSVGRTAESR